MLRHRAVTPYHLVRYARLARFRLLHPHVVTTGMLFLGRDVRVECRPGYARLVLGRWVHLGDGVRIQAHEGTTTLGDKCVLGRQVTLSSYLDLEVGAGTLMADWAYVTDFDHVTGDVARPIKDQGIAKAPVRIGPGSWLGVRATVLRGTTLGAGTVVAAHAVARGTHPDHVVLAGTPARVVRDLAAPAWPTSRPEPGSGAPTDG